MPTHAPFEAPSAVGSIVRAATNSEEMERVTRYFVDTAVKVGRFALTRR